jgi:aspartyl-tRNA(Asn)/glutamyl-tRNA(Gln) amidotransferase subunit C
MITRCFFRHFSHAVKLRTCREAQLIRNLCGHSHAMNLTPDEVKKIARLARLAINESEVPVYVASLSKLINMVEQLSAAEIADIEPMAHPLPSQVQRLRADAVVDSDQREKYQLNAASVEAGLYLVPKVIE